MRPRSASLALALACACGATSHLTPGQERMARQLAQGEELWRSGDFRPAQRVLEQALAQAEAVDDLPARTGALLSLGRVLEESAPDQARLRYDEAARVAAGAGALDAESTALSSLGSLESAAGRHDSAAKLLDRAVALARLTHDTRLLARRLGERGVAARRAGELDRALALYGEALALQRRAGDALGEAGTRANLAVVLIEQRQLAAAREHLEAALAIYHGRGEPEQIASALERLGHVERLGGRLEVALDYLDRAFRAYRAIKRFAQAVAVLEESAQALEAAQRPEEAARCRSESARLQAAAGETR